MEETQRCPGMYRKGKRCTGKIENVPRELFINEGEIPTEVYACDKCGRLYYENGLPVVDNDGGYAILVGEGKAMFTKGAPFSRKTRKSRIVF